MTDIGNDGGTPDELTSEQKALAKRTAAEITAGKVQLADVWAALRVEPEVRRTGDPERRPPKPLALSEDEKIAIKRLPEVYGRVAPEDNRLLTQEELVLLIEERGIIDTVLKVIKTRKDESIRETLANHLDHVFLHVADADTVALTPIDKKGHVQTKQDVPVDGTGRKVQKTVSDPKPQLSMASVEQAHKDGKIDRKTYLKITRMPEVPRVLDEPGLAKAIKDDPSLLYVLAPYTTVADKITTIKVV